MRVVLSRLEGPSMVIVFVVETLTVTVFVIPPTIAVMVDVPFVAAAEEVKFTVATPLLFTVVAPDSVPIPLSELPQVTEAPLGITVPPLVTESVSVVVALPLVSVWLGGFSVTVGGTTVMVAVAYCCGILLEGVFVAVMVVVPAETAVTTPVLRSTVAIAGLPLPYVTEPV